MLAPVSLLDQLRRLPGLGAIPGGDEPLHGAGSAPPPRSGTGGTGVPGDEQPPDRFGAGDVLLRLVALVLVAFAVVFFVVGTYFWTRLMTDTFSPLGYAMTPIGMYGLLIVLIPVMGIIHGLWTSSDVKRRRAESLAAARDKLRVSLLASPDNVDRVHSAPMPASMLFGESEEDLRRRRREQQQARREDPRGGVGGA
jgi:hypothetical protein